MKITGNYIERGFNIEIKGKTYYAQFINADFQTLALLNRNYLEITDENGEDASNDLTPKQLEKITELVKQNFWSEDVKYLVEAVI